MPERVGSEATLILKVGGWSRGSSRVNRGGSWNNSAENCTAAYRNANSPGNANNNLGFRLLAAPLDRGRTNGTDRLPAPSYEGRNRSLNRPVVVSSENPPGGSFSAGSSSTRHCNLNSQPRTPATKSSIAALSPRLFRLVRVAALPGRVNIGAGDG